MSTVMIQRLPCPAVRWLEEMQLTLGGILVVGGYAPAPSRLRPR